MTKKQAKHSKFEGFPVDRQTWNFPTVINGWVNELSGAEFKVLWYIIRHTFGWQKTEDYISYSQFRNGIKRKDDTWLDRGTGLSNGAIGNALNKLIKLGFIEKVGDSKSGKTTCYRPRFATSPNNGDPLSKKWRPTSPKNRNTIYKEEEDNKEPLIKIPLIPADGELNIFQADINEWQKTFPGVDVMQVLREVRQRNIDIAPDERNKRASVRRYISACLKNKKEKQEQVEIIYNVKPKPLSPNSAYSGNKIID